MAASMSWAVVRVWVRGGFDPCGTDQPSLTVSFGVSLCSELVCSAADNETIGASGGLSSGMTMRDGVLEESQNNLE